MNTRVHLNNIRNIAGGIDWADSRFSWGKAYVASVFAALAYEEIPEFELKKSKRAKIIPSDSYQAHIARWESRQIRAAIENIDGEFRTITIVRRAVLITITQLQDVIFISLRGTTLCYADIVADVDARKASYSLGFGEKLRFHRGFFEAVIDCIDEVVEKVRDLRTGDTPIYITGHSLGGAMAAIFLAKLAEGGYHPYFRPRTYQIPEAVACYTFGMPRYQDLNAKAYLPQPFHIFNELDPVPTLPPTMMGFVDSPDERCLNSIPELTMLKSKGNVGLRAKRFTAKILSPSDHRMERYLERTQAMYHGVEL